MARALLILSLAAGTGLAHGQAVWTGNNDGSFHSVPRPGGPVTIQYPNTGAWNTPKVLDGFGNIIAPGNWNTEDYPNGSDIDVEIGPAVAGKSYPPRIQSNAYGDNNGSITLRDLKILPLGRVELASTFTSFGTLTIHGEIENQGTISMSSTHGIGSRLQVSGGDIPLTGGGTVSMSSGGIRGLAPTDRLVNVDNTICGSGDIGEGVMGIVNGGIVDATSSTGTLSVRPGAAIVANTGTMRASQGGTLLFGNAAVDNSGGVIQALSGSTVRLYNSDVSGDGTLEVLTGGILRSDGVPENLPSTARFTGDLHVHAGGTVSLFTDALGRQNLLQLRAGSTVQNDGNIAVGSSAELQIAGGEVPLSGIGQVNLSGGLFTGGSAEARLHNQSTIQGRGTLGSFGSGISNVGLIQANVSGQTLTVLSNAAGLTNGGTLRATAGGRLTLQGGVIDNQAGAIRAENGSTVQLAGASITGGTLEVVNGGSFSSSSGQFNGTIHNRAGGQITISGLTLGTGSLFLNEGIAVLPGSLVATGAQVRVADGGIFDFDRGTGSGVLTGGTLRSEGTGVFRVQNGRFAALSGSITGEDAVIQMNSTGARTEMVLNGPIILGGSTRFEFSTGDNRFNTTASGSSVTIPNDARFALAGGTARLISTSLSNQGLLEISAASIDAASAGLNNQGRLSIAQGSTLAVGGLSNLSGTALNGGSWHIAGTMRIGNTNISTNSSQLILDGPAGQITKSTGGSALSSLSVNSTNAEFSLLNGNVFARTGGLTNAGLLLIDDQSQMALTAGYVQNSGQSIVDGILSASFVTLNNGILSGNGTVAGNMSSLAATVAPGSSPGALHIDGSYTQGAAGNLVLEIAGLSPGAEFDQLWVTGNANLAGSIDVVFTDGYLPRVGDVFDLMHVGGSFNASLAQLRLFNVPTAFEYTTAFDDGAYWLTVTAVPEPSCLLLAGLGAAGLAIVARRRARRATASLGQRTPSGILRTGRARTRSRAGAPRPANTQIHRQGPT